MRIRTAVIAALLFVVGCDATPSRAPGRVGVTVTDADIAAAKLRHELLAMVDEDQAARTTWIASGSDADRLRVVAVDRTNTARLREIITANGWPGYQRVGEAGAHAAWVLAQHADADRAFQQLCLDKLSAAVAAHDADPISYAYLYDRVAVAEHRPQRFGTQFGASGPAPIEDEVNVDARRAAIGLPSMAEYRRQIEAMYGPGRGQTPRR